MQLSVVVNGVPATREVFAIEMREVHLSPPVVEGAEVDDAC